MTTRTQIIEGLKAAKHEHGKRLGGLMNCRKKEDSNEQCECEADQKNASIDAAIALLEKQPAEQVEPVAYPDKGLIEEWWDAHDRKRFDPTYPSENWTEVVVRRAIDWYRSSTAKEVAYPKLHEVFAARDKACSEFTGDELQAMALVKWAIDWHRNQQASASKEVPADVLAVLDELEKIAIRSCSSECTINFEYMSMPECTCGTRNRNAMLEDRFAKLRSLLGGEKCIWRETEEMWEADCGAAWTFNDGGPKENSMKYCHVCGKEIAIEACHARKEG